MEVHHHGHVHHQKKWKDYLFQFLMLFLAVFLGFLAEYQLEHTIEKVKEKEYIRLLVQDLQTDTAVLHNQIPLMEQNVRGLDTLINQTYQYIDGKVDTRMLYYAYHHYCRSLFTLQLSQRTVTQLKNSGNLRLIHDRQSAAILDALETGMDGLKERTEFYRRRQEDPSSFGLRIFDFREYQRANVDSAGHTDKNESGFLKLSYQPELNVKDPVYLREFAARVGYFRNYFETYIDVLKSAIPFLERCIGTLSTNYHFKIDENFRVK